MGKRNIEGRIYDGQRLIERLSRDSFVDTDENLSKFKEEQINWSEKVISILGRMFSDKSLANEFQSVSRILFDENDSYLEEKNRLINTINQQIRWLTTLAERINEFPQSHNTPVVSRGR